MPVPVYTMPFTCPACRDAMMVTELSCPSCGTRVQGQFAASALHRLTPEQLQFVEVFLRCRGNIREVERDLKISYPTVRSRLDQILTAMGYPVEPGAAEPQAEAEPSDVLEALARGELTFEEALRRLEEK